jgi:hypothetical protein
MSMVAPHQLMTFKQVFLATMVCICSCRKGLISNYRCCWQWWNQVTGDDFTVYIASVDSLSLSFCLLLDCHKCVYSSIYCHHILLYLQPKAMEPVDQGLKPLQPCAKINFSSFKFISLRYFVTMMKSWHTDKIC